MVPGRGGDTSPNNREESDESPGSVMIAARSFLAATLAVAAISGCSDDDTVGTIPIVPTSATASLPSTVPPVTPTTQPPTSVSSETSPTSTVTAPPTTEGQDLNALREDVRTDWLRNHSILFEFVQHPTEADLRPTLDRTMVKGSAGYGGLLRRYRRMIDTNQRIVLGEPPVATFHVESVVFVGDPPYEQAFATTCEVENLGGVRVTEDGEIEYLDRPDGVDASRVEYPMRLTKTGWKEFTVVDSFVDRWEGARQCRDES